MTKPVQLDLVKNIRDLVMLDEVCLKTCLPRLSLISKISVIIFVGFDLCKIIAIIFIHYCFQSLRL